MHEMGLASVVERTFHLGEAELPGDLGSSLTAESQGRPRRPVMLLVLYQLRMKILTTISAPFLLLPANVARVSHETNANQLTGPSTKLQTEG